MLVSRELFSTGLALYDFVGILKVYDIHELVLEQKVAIHSLTLECTETQGKLHIFGMSKMLCEV